MAHENTVNISGQPIQPFRPFTNGAAPATAPAQAGQAALPTPAPVQAGSLFSDDPLVSFKENPLGAIGLILGEIDKGRQGKPSGVPGLAAARQKSQVAQEQLALDKIKVGYAALDQMRKFIEEVPENPDLQRQFADTLNPTLAKLIPGLDLKTFVDDPTEAASRIKEIMELHPSSWIGVPPREVVDIRSDPTKLKFLKEQSHDRSIGPATNKLVDFIQNFEERTTPERRAEIQEAISDGVTFTEVSQFSDDIGFEPWELAAVGARQDTLFPQLKAQLKVDFQSAGALQKRAEERTPAEIRQDAEAQARGTTAGTPDKQSALATLNADLAAGRITPAQHTAGVEKATSLGFGRTPEDVAATAAGGAAGRLRVEAAVEAVDIGTQLEQLRGLVTQLNRVGEGATGFRGFIAERGGGILGQINEELGEGFTELIAGTSVSEVQGLRTDMITTMVSFIPETTGEESGRITNAERELAREATRLLKVDASFPQIKAAVGTLTKLKIIARQKKLFLSGQDFDYDVENTKGRREAIGEFIDGGLSAVQAGDLLKIITRMNKKLGTSPQDLGLDKDFGRGRGQ